MKRLLLISNSTLHGSGYLDHCAAEITGFLGREVQRILFVPYAIQNCETYAQTVRERVSALGYALDSVHTATGHDGARAAVARAQAIFIGGGNTFRLLTELYAYSLIDAIRARVGQGMPYMGASAGSNVACITIKTTNDMPIVHPPTFDALALVPFNLNPHYQDPVEGSTHMGETREQRIREFHEENDPPVVGLREGALLRIENRRVELRGSNGARLFRKNEPPVELASGARLDFLLDG